jgi:hypothetical protein
MLPIDVQRPICFFYFCLLGAQILCT